MCSPTVNLIAVTTLLNIFIHFYWYPIYIAANKEYLRTMQIIFMLLKLAFH